MSGIFGIYELDGDQVSPVSLEAMGRALEHRGHDGHELSIRGQIGIGSCLLLTQPERPSEILQLDNCEAILMAADVRLDNRDELFASLRSHNIKQDLDDRGLVLAAYRKWGHECTDKLRGDFAFAIWDGKKRQLFCARDHYGVKPFYYCFKDGRSFAFASEMKALLALPEVSSELNEVRIAEHLAGIVTESESTFYKEIHRLSPGHCLIASREGLSLRRYYVLGLPELLILKSDAEYSEAFRDCFVSAVKSRLRSRGGVGSMLSGGLDSSSITCVARDLLRQTNSELGNLQTFSAVFDQVSECDERFYIDAIHDQGGTQRNFVPVDDVGPFVEFDEMLRHQDCAFFAPGLLLHWKVLKQVAEKGINVLLDGFDGDNTVSYGFDFHKELARNRRWLTLGSEVFALSRLHKTSFFGPMSAYVKRFGINPAINHSRVLSFLRRSFRRFKKQQICDTRKRAYSNELAQYLTDDFRCRTQIDERVREWRNNQPKAAATQREAHLRSLKAPAMVQALEVLDHTSNAFGVELRLPFWDKRLIDFCLSIPPQQKINKGRDRVIFRRAMHGYVPDKVRWRVGKADFTPNLFHGLLSTDHSIVSDAIQFPTVLAVKYIKLEHLKALFTGLSSGKSRELGSDLQQFWRGIVLVLWLEFLHRNQLALKEVTVM